MAANNDGSLYISGRLRILMCEKAPVPSRQNMPAPMPPIGNAKRFRYSPLYVVLYFRLEVLLLFCLKSSSSLLLSSFTFPADKKTDGVMAVPRLPIASFFKKDLRLFSSFILLPFYFYTPTYI